MTASRLAAEPAHIARVAAEILRVVARHIEDQGATLVHVDTLNAIAAGLDKQAGGTP